MKTFKYLLLCFFLSFTISLVIYSQTAQVEQSFIFSDEFNNTQELIIGYDPFGSDGLDPDLGEVIIPQVPPGEFGVRFQLPPDTSITTIKDIRFGCGQPFYYEHLIDLSYETGSTILDVYWSWDWPLYMVDFINPYNGVTLAHYISFYDSTHFILPASIEKIIIAIQYNGPLSWPEYEIISPNGGETLIGGEYYTVTWWSNGISPPSKLEYSSDAGNSWTIIIDSLFLVNNSYDWLVPNISSFQCLVRVGEYPCAYDQSNSYFTITYPVSVTNEDEIPTEFSLEQNYPNPFNPITTIRFTIPTVERFAESLKSINEQIGNSLYNVQLKVYDVLGNEVATLVNKDKPAGSYEVEFDATGLPSGVYFYRLTASSFLTTKKMSLLK